MKIVLTALAMIIAAPAAAQTTAPAADPHAGHAQHGQPAQDHSKHDMSDHKGGMKCCEKGPDGKMLGCAKAKAAGSKMDCCAKHKGKKADAHAGHDMSKK